MCSFTNIAVQCQQWHGWPSDVSDDSTLALTGIPYDHNLVLYSTEATLIATATQSLVEEKVIERDIGEESTPIPKSTEQASKDDIDLGIDDSCHTDAYGVSNEVNNLSLDLSHPDELASELDSEADGGDKHVKFKILNYAFTTSNQVYWDVIFSCLRQGAACDNCHKIKSPDQFDNAKLDDKDGIVDSCGDKVENDGFLDCRWKLHICGRQWSIFG